MSRHPDHVLGLRSLLDDYETVAPIKIDGKVPLNYFTFRPNFGDLLSPWLVQKMTGCEVRVAERSKPHYMVIGSVVSQSTDQTIIWGAGAYGTEGKGEVAAGATYTAVRGPLTQAKLSASKGFGIDTPEVYGDPTLLLPLYFTPEVPIRYEYGVVVRWNERQWANATYGDGVKLIDLANEDIESVIRDFLSCRRIITSSLAGMVVADAYGIPSAWIASRSPRGGVFKYYDYFASVNAFRVPHEFEPTAGPVTVDRLRDGFTFSDATIDFDYRALLDASPLLRRRTPARGMPTVGRDLRTRPGRETLLPSLGYFGAIAVNYLSVPVSPPISRIRLVAPGLRAELDLRGVELYLNGRRVAVDESKVVFAQSSEAGRSAAQRRPFAYGGIRSAKEADPWWTATFAPAIEADEVRIYNRMDGWGARARSLTVTVTGPDGESVSAADSDAEVQATIALLSRLTGAPLDVSVLDSEDAAARARSRILAELNRRAASGLLTDDREEQRRLASLLHTQPPPGGDGLADEEWTLLGHLLAAERARVPNTKTSVVAFHRVLRSRAELRRIEAEVNRAGARLGSPEAVLTRHGFSDIGILRQRSDDFMALIHRATDVLEECGYSAMLAYGTLLGAVREGDFLAHDDDIDMLIPVAGVSTRDEVETVLAELAEQLRSKGWKFSRPNTYTNFHLTDPSSGLHLDVFPVLINGERATLHMEKMKLRDIAANIVVPVKPFMFKGEQTRAPADPEAFLAERYGNGWPTPDPFYDWPWKLDS